MNFIKIRTCTIKKKDKTTAAGLEPAQAEPM